MSTYYRLIVSDSLSNRRLSPFIINMRFNWNVFAWTGGSGGFKEEEDTRRQRVWSVWTSSRGAWSIAVMVATCRRLHTHTHTHTPKYQPCIYLYTSKYVCSHTCTVHLGCTTGDIGHQLSFFIMIGNCYLDGRVRDKI